MTEEELTKGERTRAALIEAAAQQFAAQGYHGTSVRQIAEAVGLTVAGVYRHFPSKEELFQAALREKHPFSTILPTLTQLEGDTFDQLLRAAAHRFIGALEQDPQSLNPVFNLMFIELVEFEGRHLPELVAAFAPHMFAFADRLMAAGGRLRPLSPVILLRSFIGLIFTHYLFNRLMAHTPVALDEPGSLDTLVDVLLYGLVEPGGR